MSSAGETFEREELERLRQSEARFRALAENAGDLLVQYRTDGVIQYASPSAVNFGFDPNDLVGRNIREFLAPGEEDPTADNIRNILAGKPPRRGVENERRIVRPDGSVVWVQGHPTPILDAAGTVTGVLTILRDVTERRMLEEKAHYTEARYRMLADNATDYIIRYDLRGIIQFASPSVSALGYAPSDLVGKLILDLCHPDDRKQVTQNTLRAMASEGPPSEQRPAFRMLAHDGSFVWVEGNPGFARNDAGEIESVVTVLRDVSERHAFEELLAQQRHELEAAFERVAESEQRYRLLAEQSPDIIIRYDLNGRVEYISPAIRRYGVEPERLIGRKLEELLDASEVDRSAAWMADLVAGRDLPQGRKNVWRTPMPGGAVDWEGATNPLVEDGKVVGAISVLRDVTEREALEAALRAKQTQTQIALEQYRESEARYRVLAENASDVIIRIGASGLVEFASPSIAVFGYRPEDIVGRAYPDFVHPDDNSGKVRAALRAGEAAPAGADNEFRLLCGDGRWALVQGSPAAIRNEDGEIEGVVTVLRDVTEQRRLEDELRRKESDAQAAVRAKAEFLANMSHEIRTPLTAVVGFSGLMAKMRDLPDKARTYADRIGRSGDALAAIVNNVLDFSRVEAGQVELRREPIELSALVEDVFGVVREQAGGKGLALSARIAPETPAQVMGDAGRLRQVLLNLLTNAVKFTHEGGIAIEAGYDARRQRLRLAVRDTGIGIPSELSDRLFQRFSQVDGSNARRFGGVGLGLAISKGLVELMGGEIGVLSAEGQGSTFWFAIPAEPTETAPASAEGPEAAAPALTPLKVLLVDDAQPNRELIIALLGPFACHVVEAENGVAAVEAARREPFDVVLMDLQMPGMDGMAAAREIRRAAAPNQHTPILAVSASVLPCDVEACQAAGMNDHIAKPINARELVGKLAQWTAAEAPQPA